MNRILPNQDRAVFASIALGASLFIKLILKLIMFFKTRSMYEASTFEPEQEALTNIVTLSAIFVVVYLVLLIICATTFIMWFRRAYANLHRIGSTFLSYSEGWAAGAWFIPIGNLFLPYRIMNETWIETQDNLRPDSTHKEDNGLTLIGWWWGCWIFYNVANYLLQAMSGLGYGTARLFSAARMDLLGEIISIPACILAILVIQKLNALEQDMVDPSQTSDPIDHLIA